MAKGPCSWLAWNTHLQSEMTESLLLHLHRRKGERRERKGPFTLCNHTSFGVLGDALLHLGLRACLSACSSVCLCARTICASTSGPGLQDGCEALKGCLSAVILIPPARIQVLFCMCLHHSLPPLSPTHPPPSFHYLCFIVIDFKGQGEMMEECLVRRLPHPALWAIEEGCC